MNIRFGSDKIAFNLACLIALVCASLLVRANFRSSAIAQSLPAGQTADAKQLTPDDANLRSFVELARSDIHLHKSLIIAQNLPLTDEESAVFWPLHREYEDDLDKINDQRLSLIKKYFADGAALTDDQARTLADEAFNLENQRTELKRTYFKRFQTAIPAAKAARFFQIENQLNMVVDLQIAAALPLIK
jgi:hypothetical protein